MLDYLRQVDPLSRTVRRFQKAGSAAIAYISARIGSNPPEEAIADQMGLEIEGYRKLSRTADTSSSVSFEAHGPYSAAVAQTRHPDADFGIHALDAAMHSLSQVEFIVITAIRAGETNRTIAQQLHVTEGRVGQIKTCAISHLRSAMGVPQPAQA